jgi:hypothetical protein
MSVSCPNPNHPDFIKLKEQLGEKEAYRQYMLNANEIPNPDLYENVKLDNIKSNDLLNTYNNINISNAEKDTYKITIDNNLYIDNSESKDSYYGYWMPVILDGKEVGRIRFEQKINVIEQGKPAVKTFSPNIQIYEKNNQGKGIGSKVHLALYKYVKSIYPNTPFVSDVQNTVAEMALLRSFEKKGITTQINPIGEISEKYGNYSVEDAPFIFNDSYFQQKQQVEDDDIPLTDLQLYGHANKFFSKLKVPFQLMSEEELAIWNKSNPDRAIGANTKGFFDPSTNKVYLIKGRAGFFTTLHEFTHPLVEWIFRNNNPLFKTLVSRLKAEKGEQPFIDILNQSGYAYLLKDGSMTDAAWKEVLTTEIESASKSILTNAGVKKSSFLEAVKLFWKKIKEAISSFVSKDIGKLNDKQLLNLTINDLAVFMLDGDVKLDLHAPFLTSLSTVPNESYGMLYYKIANTEFQTAVDRQIEEYKKRTGKEVSSNQLNTINNLLAYQGLVRGEDGYYDSVLDINYRRATEFLSTLKGPNDEENYFAYHGDEDDEIGLTAAEWGNQVDELVQHILNGLDAQSAITQVIDNHNSRTEDDDTLAKKMVSEEVLEELHERLKNYLGNKFKDYVVLTQVMLADPTTGVAGTADIVLISPDGKIKIVDIKTTKYSSEGTEYIKTYPLSSSKKQKHAGQLTIYKGLAKSMGLVVDESDDLAIIPVYFPDTNVDVIDEARLEPEVPIAAFEYILNMFETGDTEAMEETKSDDPEVNLIKQIKIILTKRLSDINKMPAGFKKSQALVETKTILDTLNQAESTKKLTEFVTGLHKQFTNQIKENKAGRKYTIYGLPSQIKYLTLELASGKINRDEALSKFLHIKNINDLYSPLLDDIRNIINSKDDTTVKSEMSDKLNEIQNGIAFIKKTYEDETVEIMSDILVENVSEKANERAKTHLKTLKERLDAATSDKAKKKAQENYDYALRNLKSEEGITREVIIKALKEGSSKDIDWVDLWFTPAVTSSSELVAPFAMALKTKLEDARQDLITFERDAGQAYEKFGDFAGKGNPAEYNKGLYQTVDFFDSLDKDGNAIFKQKQMFVSPIDLQKFHKVKAEFEKQLASTADPKQQNAIRNKFYSDNFVRKSEENTVVINPITNQPVVIEEGIKALIEHKRQLYLKNIISEIDFNEYVKSTRGEIRNGVTVYNKEFLTINPVKFKNDAYAALESSGKKQYYDFLISSYFKSQARLPHKMGYVLPSIHKSGADSILEGGLINYIKYEGSQLLSFKAEEISKYGEEGKNIPLIFNFDMDAKDVSLDLIQSIVMYEAESLEYRAKSEVAESGEVLLSFVEKNAPYQTDSIGNKELDAFAEKAGIKDEFLKYKKKLGGNNIAAMLTMYLDAQIYGKLNIKSGVTIFGKDLEKLVNGVMSFASVTQVGGNPIGSAANYLQAAIQAVIEAAAKDKISDASWLKSRLIYDKHIIDYVKDFNSPYSKSFMGQLIDLYDPMQGEYKDAAGRRISKGAFKKLWSTNTWFFLQHIGEHSIQVRTMIGMMLDAKAIDKDGKYINLIDAYELDPQTNILRVKDGVTLPGKLSANKLISREFQGSLHSLNKKLQGVYNEQDKINAERHTWGRLLTMYKKFLAPGLKRRYKALGYDQELGDITEGYLKTFYNKIRTDASQLGRFMIGIDNGYYNEFEKQNLRRARREMLIVATAGTMVMLLSALIEGSDDDDDKKKLKYLLYLSMRIDNELGIYGTFGDPQSGFFPNPSEIYKTVKNPIPAYGVTDRLNKLIKQMFDPFEEYKAKSGVWEKGDSKLWAAFLKFWGQNGTNYDPSNSIKWMNMSTK